MPDVNYIITIRNKSSNGGGGVGGEYNNSGTPNGGADKPDGIDRFVEAISALHLVSKAANTIKSQIAMTYDTVAIMTGSSAYHARIQRELELAEQGATTVAAAIAGFAATGGPGALVPIISAGLDYINRRDAERTEYSRGLTMESVTRQLANRRSGVDNRNTELLD